MNRALVEIHQELDKRAGPAQVSSSTATVSAEKQALWLWKNNRLLQGTDLVVWDVESYNHDPSNMLWDRTRAGFILVQGGLYQISFGFFATQKPRVEVLLNDEPILSSKPGKLKEKTFTHVEPPNQLGINTGLTCLEYFIVPPKGKLTFAVKGIGAVEGFILIRKV